VLLYYLYKKRFETFGSFCFPPKICAKFLPAESSQEISGFPDGIFSNQKSQCGWILEGLEVENVRICYSLLEYITAIWYTLWPFGTLLVIWFIFPRFGILYQEKSGNPARTCFWRPEIGQDWLLTTWNKIQMDHSEAWTFKPESRARKDKKVLSQSGWPDRPIFLRNWELLTLGVFWNLQK
jgi:hypothetical protein